MSFGIAVQGKDKAGGAHMAGGQGFWKVEGSMVALKGDKVKPHGPFPHGLKPPAMIEGSGWMKLNGTPVCRQGHKASCLHVSTGRGWFKIAN